MTHGAPDYSNVQTIGVIYRLDDMAELAARLGSIVLFDRRGVVLFLNNFDYGVQGLTVSSQGSASEYLVEPEIVYNGPFSLRLPAGSTTNDFVKLYKVVSLPDYPIMGLSVLCYFASTANEVWLEFRKYTGSLQYIARVKIAVETSEVWLYDENGDYVLIANDLPDFRGNEAFIHLKLVCDLDTNNYVRLIVGDIVYLLSAYPIYSQASSTAKKVEGAFQNTVTDNVTGLVIIDNLIITTSEPI